MRSATTRSRRRRKTRAAQKQAWPVHALMAGGAGLRALHQDLLPPERRPVMRKLLALTIAAAFALGTAADAFAAPKKSRAKRVEAPLVQRDSHGTPIIMRGYRSRPPVTSIMTDEPGTGRVSDPPSRQAERKRPRRRGSSTYIPPPVPSPRASALPAPGLTRGPGVYQPPRINSFGDRATNAIH